MLSRQRVTTATSQNNAIKHTLLIQYSILLVACALELVCYNDFAKLLQG